MRLFFGPLPTLKLAYLSCLLVLESSHVLQSDSAVSIVSATFSRWCLSLKLSALTGHRTSQ
jgi:hypothetical protein